MITYDFFFSDVTFQPCLHQSCHACIIQHLMSVRSCFYCKTLISNVVQLDGTNLYTNESHRTRESQTESIDDDEEA
jgi:hypothetical protein